MPPPTKRTIALFFAKLVLIYALLILPWPHLRSAYARLFSAAGNAAFRVFGSGGRVYFAPILPTPSRNDAKDTSVRLENIKVRGGGTMEMNSRLMGYLPTAFAAALVLATPVPRRRRLLAVSAAILLMSAFAGLELALRLLDAFSDQSPFAVFSFSRPVKGALAIILKVIAMSPVTAYIAPVFVWLTVTFRADDWKALFPARGAAPSLAAR